MVMSYYGQTMYRQQQITPPNVPFQANTMEPWYPGYHQPAVPPSSYCVQEEQQMRQMWHHPHGVFQHEFQDFLHTGSIPQIAPHNQVDGESLHSPTVSGSDMSSPGAQSGNISPPQNSTRPPQARSPFEWIKKTSYQTQPNPGKCLSFFAHVSCRS